MFDFENWMKINLRISLRKNRSYQEIECRYGDADSFNFWVDYYLKC